MILLPLFGIWAGVVKVVVGAVSRFDDAFLMGFYELYVCIFLCFYDYKYIDSD